MLRIQSPVEATFKREMRRGLSVLGARQRRCYSACNAKPRRCRRVRERVPGSDKVQDFARLNQYGVMHSWDWRQHTSNLNLLARRLRLLVIKEFVITIDQTKLVSSRSKC